MYKNHVEKNFWLQKMADFQESVFITYVSSLWFMKRVNGLCLFRYELYKYESGQEKGGRGCMVLFFHPLHRRHLQWIGFDIGHGIQYNYCTNVYFIRHNSPKKLWQLQSHLQQGWKQYQTSEIISTDQRGYCVIKHSA